MKYISLPIAFYSTLLAGFWASAADCNSYSEKIKTCAPFSCKIEMKIFGQTVQQVRQIKGLRGDICHTSESTQGKVMKTCRYPKSKLAALARFEQKEQANLSNGRIKIKAQVTVGADDSNDWVEAGGERFENFGQYCSMLQPPIDE